MGAGASGTRAAGESPARLAGWPEVRAALVTVPPFVRHSAAGVLAHFARLAEVSPVPLVVYHAPYRAGRPLDAAALRAIGSLPGVAGVKYAGGGIDEDAVALLGDLPRREPRTSAGHTERPQKGRGTLAETPERVPNGRFATNGRVARMRHAERRLARIGIPALKP